MPGRGGRRLDFGHGHRAVRSGRSADAVADRGQFHHRPDAEPDRDADADTDSDSHADPDPEPTPVPLPTKAPFLMDVYRPGTFVSQMNREYCMAGAIQNMLNIIGPSIDLTATRQKQIGSLLVSLTTHQDSFNGGFGPAGWALTMPKLGAGKYKLVIDPTFDQAMQDAALALARRAAGRAAHLVGRAFMGDDRLSADADPLLFPDTFKLKRRLHRGPVLPAAQQDLGPDAGAGHIPGHGRDGPQLHRLEASRGPVPGP